MTTKIYLIRHGLTNVPEAEQKPEDGLSDIGKTQIKQAASKLQAVTDVRVIYTSTFDRAKQSGEIIAETIGCHDIREDASLIEIGAWTSPTELHDPKIVPQRYAHAIESLTLSQQKAIQFLRKVSEEHLGQNIVIVSHGNIIRAIIAQAIAAGVETTVRMAVHNASISVLEYDAEDKLEPFFRLTLFNDTGHIS